MYIRVQSTYINNYKDYNLHFVLFLKSGMGLKLIFVGSETQTSPYCACSVTISYRFGFSVQSFTSEFQFIRDLIFSLETWFLLIDLINSETWFWFLVHKIDFILEKSSALHMPCINTWTLMNENNLGSDLLCSPIKYILCFQLRKIAWL